LLHELAHTSYRSIDEKYNVIKECIERAKDDRCSEFVNDPANNYTSPFYNSVCMEKFFNQFYLNECATQASGECPEIT
jgi:hypothetical protein